ncbi:unnamed protein product, partial [Heterotrigona itama]
IFSKRIQWNPDYLLKVFTSTILEISCPHYTERFHVSTNLILAGSQFFRPAQHLRDAGSRGPVFLRSARGVHAACNVPKNAKLNDATRTELHVTLKKLKSVVSKQIALNLVSDISSLWPLNRDHSQFSTF